MLIDCDSDLSLFGVINQAAQYIAARRLLIARRMIKDLLFAYWNFDDHVLPFVSRCLHGGDDIVVQRENILIAHFDDPGPTFKRMPPTSGSA
jgi:hypothetical protein